VHVCNDVGGWGSGFVLALNRRSMRPMEAYRRWARGELGAGAPFELGRVQPVAIAPDVVILNLIGQHGVRPRGAEGEPPVRYEAIRAGLERVARYAKDRSALSVHMPRIGSDLAGGEWWRIEEIIEEALLLAGVRVVVYDPDEAHRKRFTSPPHTPPQARSR
jgi:O-acetyl-ADP-ribose deacetylase (regulator of RNase III)